MSWNMWYCFYFLLKKSNGLDNCARGAQSWEKDVTMEAKHIVELVNVIQSDKITMTHAIDVFRGLKHAKIIQLGMFYIL